MIYHYHYFWRKSIGSIHLPATGLWIAYMLSALLHHKSSRSSHRQPQPDAQLLSVPAPHSEEISQEMSGVSARRFTEKSVGGRFCFVFKFQSSAIITTKQLFLLQIWTSFAKIVIDWLRDRKRLLSSEHVFSISHMQRKRREWRIDFVIKFLFYTFHCLALIISDPII